MPMQQLPLAHKPSCVEILELSWLAPLIKPARLHGVQGKMQNTVNFSEVSCPVFI